VLNTPKENRFKNLDEQLAEFPYVNGKLFEEILPMASFDSKMREALLIAVTLIGVKFRLLFSAQCFRA
jgi:hypothetical protein